MTTTHSHDVISSDRVVGTNVYDAAGHKLGHLDALMIDKRSGEVRYAVMAFGGFLGLGTDRYPVPWSSLEYDSERSGYVVQLDRSKLEGAPKYDNADPPIYTPEYTLHLNSYYGVDW